MADAGKAQSAMIKASRDAQGRVAKSIGQAQAAVESVKADINQGVMSDIEKAAIPLVDLGIDLPSTREIQQIKTALIDNQPYPVIPEGACTCQPHLLLEAYRIGYTDLVYITGQGYCVMQPPVVAQLLQQMPKGKVPSLRVLFNFSKWWRAELACRLLTECSALEKDLLNKWTEIDQVEIYSGQSNMQALGMCRYAEQWLGVSGSATIL